MARPSWYAPQHLGAEMEEVVTTDLPAPPPFDAARLVADYMQAHTNVHTPPAIAIALMVAQILGSFISHTDGNIELHCS